MPHARTATAALHHAALGIWAGAIIMTGATAALAFPAMRDLGPTIPGFAIDESDHWLTAAGAVMNRAFLASDLLGAACALVAAATLVLLAAAFGARLASPAGAIRTLALAGAVGVTIYSLALLRPDMQSALDAYHAAARAGDATSAAAQRDAFDALHPLASNLLVTQLILVLLALGAGFACDAAPPRPPSTTEPPR